MSGFVLPLSFFRTRKNSSIFGAVFRRYIRLMLPVLGIFPLYYFFVKIDFWPQYDTPASLVKVKDKSFGMLLLDCLIGTWFGNKDYTSAAWTLSVELWSSFYVFIIAETIVHYKYRWYLYSVLILFIAIPIHLETFHQINY